MQFNHLQRLTVKIALAALLAVEVIVIGVYYSPHFEEYAVLVALALCVPIAYFAYRYIQIAYRYNHPEVEVYSAIDRKQPSAFDATQEEVKKLLSSDKFKKYQAELQSKRAKSHGGQGEGLLAEEQLSEEQMRRRQELECVLTELQQKESQIFEL